MSIAMREYMRRNPTAKRETALAKVHEKDYSDGVTKQSFKDSTDINKILARAQREGTLSHLQKFEAEYGDFSDFDYQDAAIRLARGRTIFEELPSEIRREFRNDPKAFFEYVNDPENVGELHKKLPALAAPGRQLKRLNFPAAEPASGSEPLSAEPTVGETAAPEEPPAGGGGEAGAPDSAS